MKTNFIKQIKDLYQNKKIAKLIRKLNIEKRTIFDEKECMQKLQQILLKNNIKIKVSHFLVKKLKYFDLGILDKQNNINRADGTEKNKRYDIETYNGFSPKQICENLKIKSDSRIRSNIFYQNILYIVGRYDIIPYFLPNVRKKRTTKQKI